MQEVYRIIVKPYSYEHWDIFTKDKNLFDTLSKFRDTDEAAKAMGQEIWEVLVDTWFEPSFPYVLLNETTLHQRD